MEFMATKRINIYMSNKKPTQCVYNSKTNNILTFKTEYSKFKKIMTKPKNIDDYISGFPEATQKLLQQVRDIIKQTVPQAEEVISYGLPAFKTEYMLVWFAAFKNHIGFYPVHWENKALKEDLSTFKGTKSSVHFPLDQPLPLELISKIVILRISENLQKETAKMN
jgi:uncharacterized protein YdhG (YjbR/CyaY superfamily)